MLHLVYHSQTLFIQAQTLQKTFYNYIVETTDTALQIANLRPSKHPELVGLSNY